MTNQDQLDTIIARMQAIQRAIKASAQPASLFELQELKDLGVEYAQLIDALSASVDATSQEKE